MTESKPTRSRTTKPAAAPEPVKATEAPKPEPKVEAPKVAKVISPLLFKRRLSQGDHGPAVVEIQRVLAAQGAWEGAQDGRYGTLLAKAVRQFQGAKGLKPTGEVDIRTWETMTA
jgi:peptidoglycan hydrolase-like protein with peptidoglycan-binding domain